MLTVFINLFTIYLIHIEGKNNVTKTLKNGTATSEKLFFVRYMDKLREWDNLNHRSLDKIDKNIGKKLKRLQAKSSSWFTTWTNLNNYSHMHDLKHWCASLQRISGNTNRVKRVKSQPDIIQLLELQSSSIKPSYLTKIL